MAQLITPLSSGDTTFTLPAYADVNSNYRTYANNVFGLLEAGRVPTGLLLDYAFDFTEPKTFNGVTLHDSMIVFIAKAIYEIKKYVLPNTEILFFRLILMKKYY
ncbi:hypothetical protein [Agriterribacter humi]|jgi:hypothetical protein|uniref:hypothetical protein n=1 Tax=Agriterribacter humi TaxID=1104781 RepID=UPI0012650870|nr:hypothetical protein [Agriterribacter humi]